MRWILLAALGLVAGCVDDVGTDLGMRGNSRVISEPGQNLGLSSTYQEVFQRESGGDRVLFDYDRSDLSKDARSSLERQTAVLRKYPDWHLTIEGHTDERGTREYNIALGERRASSVRDYLVALGIAPTRLTMVSYGKERPAVLGSNESAWAQNRRAVSVVQQAGH